MVPSHLGSGSSLTSSHRVYSTFTPNKDNPDVSQKKQKMKNIRFRLHAVVQSVLLGTPVIPNSYAFIYREVELLLIYKHSEQAKLASFIFTAIDEYFERMFFPELKEAMDRNDPDQKVRDFIHAYETWMAKLSKMLKLFLYLDRTYLLPHPTKPSIQKHGITKFVENVWEKDPNMASVLFKLHKSILLKIKTDETLLGLAKKFTSILEKLNCNGNQSDRALTDAVISNYLTLKEDWIEDPQTYIPTVLTSLSKEAEYFTETGKKLDFINELMKKLRWHLIFVDFVNIIEPTLPFLLRRENWEYLKVIARFCDSSMNDYGTSSKQSLVYVWGKFVLKGMISQIGEAKSAKVALIPLIVQLWDDYTQICTECLQDESFSFEMRSSLGKALSESSISNYVMLQLSKYCENFFKLFSKTKDLFSSFESAVLAVFKLIANKADFITIYERDISKRMLLGRTFNITAEKKLVDSILNIVGEGDEGMNLRAMFRDVEHSRTQYSHIKTEANPRMEFNALVLEKGYWPDIPKLSTDIQLPEQFSEVLSGFACKYHEESEKLKLHRLDWSNYTLHQVTILADFENGPKKLILNMLQAVVLLLFEDKEVLEFGEIVSSTNMEDKLLRRVLASLASDKYPVLKIEEGLVSYNSKFSDKSSKIRIPMGRDKDGVVLEDALKVLERNRSLEIRAAIVRTMKQERTLSYPELLGKVIKLLEGKGQVLIQDLKSNVEHLILNEYIQRGTDGQALVYIP